MTYMDTALICLGILSLICVVVVLAACRATGGE
jgi:hypothetical protein